MTDIRTENFLAILPTLQEGDVLVVEEAEDYPASLFRIQDVYEDHLTGFALFDDEEEEVYAELYEEEFYLISQVIINLNGPEPDEDEDYEEEDEEDEDA